MYRLVIANHKGGIGKSATAHALGAALALRALRVLLVDMDPQASLTAACAVVAPAPDMADVLGDARPGKVAIQRVVVGAGVPGLSVAPASMRLSESEAGIATRRVAREVVLDRALRAVDGAYDVAVIDTPPVLGHLVVNALCAAHGVLVPVVPQASDLRGLRQLVDTVTEVREAINPSLTLCGVLPTMVDARLLTHRAGLRAIAESGLPVTGVVIGRSIRVAEAAAAGKSIVDFDPDHPQARAYITLAQEVAGWMTT